MPKTEQRWAIGKRMRAAAVQAGISAYRIAGCLEVKAPTVYRWWRGQRSPAPAIMQTYAGLVGKPVSFFYESGPAPQEPSQELPDLLLDWANRLMAGEQPGVALDRVAGERQPLTRQERRRLVAAAPRMREALTQAAGGDWARLSEAEQRRILEQIARQAVPQEAAL